MPTKIIPNVPKPDKDNKFIRPKVDADDWKRYVALVKKLGSKYKIQGFLGALIDSYEETHCPECHRALDTMLCKTCGKGGTI
jgi:RNase P subunit RPR2